MIVKLHCFKPLFTNSKDRLILATSYGVFEIVGWHPPKPVQEDGDELKKPRNKTLSDRLFMISNPLLRRLFSGFCVKRLELLRTPGAFYSSIVGVATNRQVRIGRRLRSNGY